jgi:hypothetical protein
MLIHYKIFSRNISLNKINFPTPLFSFPENLKNFVPEVLKFRKI